MLGHWRGAAPASRRRCRRRPRRRAALAAAARRAARRRGRARGRRAARPAGAARRRKPSELCASPEGSNALDEPGSRRLRHSHAPALPPAGAVLAFGVDALVRNALRRRALAGRVAFALRRAALLVAPLLALLAALAAADAACLRLSAAAPAAAIATAAYQHALRPLLALAGADASVAALGARLGGAAGAGALGARAAYAAAAPLALLLLPIKALLFPLVLADLAFSGAVRAAAAALGAIVAALRPLL